MRDKHNKISGNALFMILIAIFLLGGLTVLMMRTSEQTDDSSETERATIAATEILKQSASIKAGVDMLLSRGCSETEINFGSDKYPIVWENANAAPGQACDVFRVAGAGLNKWVLPEAYYAAGFPYVADFATAISASWDVTGTPSTRTDVTVVIPYLPKDTCIQINKILGIPLEADGDVSADENETWWEAYQGRFRTGLNGLGDDAGSNHAGFKTACKRDAGHNYAFYSTLIEK